MLNGSLTIALNTDVVLTDIAPGCQVEVCFTANCVVRESEQVIWDTSGAGETSAMAILYHGTLLSEMTRSEGITCGLAGVWRGQTPKIRGWSGGQLLTSGQISVVAGAERDQRAARVALQKGPRSSHHPSKPEH